MFSCPFYLEPSFLLWLILLSTSCWAAFQWGHRASVSSLRRRITELLQGGEVAPVIRKAQIYRPVMLMRTFFAVMQPKQSDLYISERASSHYLWGHIVLGRHQLYEHHKMFLSSRGLVGPQILWSVWGANKENVTSLYSWIWLCSNMENTLEDPPSPCCCLLLAFLGAWARKGKIHFSHPKNIKQTHRSWLTLRKTYKDHQRCPMSWQTKGHKGVLSYFYSQMPNY